jgi:DMSO/TMAO reductase YedYZ molybdopterin-dependent catalytic subunit
MKKFSVTRRKFLTGAAVAGAGTALSGCDALDPLLSGSASVREFMAGANRLTYRIQRLLLGREALAEEYPEAAIRQPMRPNGSTSPQDPDYLSLAQNGFADYRLKVSGLVGQELSLSLAELKAMPSRTQITRHDCVEGWSCIAGWKGTPLSLVLDQARVKPQARFVVFHCFDTMEQSLSGAVKYYESIDMIDARHPQTILAYGMNGKDLPIENGAPLRARVERQLGYKMAKYVSGIELVDDLSTFGNGMGGYWEDRGYDWYAGI